MRGTSEGEPDPSRIDGPPTGPGHHWLRVTAPGLAITLPVMVRVGRRLVRVSGLYGWDETLDFEVRRVGDLSSGAPVDVVTARRDDAHRWENHVGTLEWLGEIAQPS